MDELSDTMRDGAYDLASRVTPAATETVRARGDALRRRRVVGMTVAATASAVIVGSAAIWGNGGGNGGPVSHETEPPAPTATTTATTAPSSPTNAPSEPTPTLSSTRGSAPTTPKEAPPVCESADLAITTSSWLGASGHVYGVFVFHNTGSTACRISGYPQVTGVDEQGVTTIVATHTLTGWAGSVAAVPTVDIPRGGNASAPVEWSNGTDDGSPCAVVAAFEVALPSGGHPTKIPMGKPRPTDGPACAHFWIHPIVAGVDPWYFVSPATPPATSN